MFLVTHAVDGMRAVKLSAAPSHFTLAIANFSPSDLQNPATRNLLFVKETVNAVSESSSSVIQVPMRDRSGAMVIALVTVSPRQDFIQDGYDYFPSGIIPANPETKTR